MGAFSLFSLKLQHACKIRWHTQDRRGKKTYCWNSVLPSTGRQIDWLASWCSRPVKHKGNIRAKKSKTDRLTDLGGGEGGWKIDGESKRARERARERERERESIISLEAHFSFQLVLSRNIRSFSAAFLIRDWKFWIRKTKLLFRIKCNLSCNFL